MAGRMSREKGKRGEREVADMLEDTVKKVFKPSELETLSLFAAGKINTGHDAAQRLAIHSEDVSQKYPRIIQRNALQADGGGFDLCGQVLQGFQKADGKGLPPLAIEVKRHEHPNVAAWWYQTLVQAHGTHIPVLFYRGNRQPWRVIIAGCFSMCVTCPSTIMSVTLTLPGWEKAFGMYCDCLLRFMQEELKAK